MTVDEIAHELYGLPPAEFVAVRTERARQARDAGDKPLAAAIGKLRRPTVAAWAVNLLVRTAPAEVRSLLDLGDALRAAQQRLSGDQLRALTTQRQQAVSALTRQAAAAAATHGQRLNESTLRDIGATLQAALADSEVGDQLRTGTLTTAASYDGFGPAILVAVPDTSARAVAKVGTKTDAGPKTDAGSGKQRPAGKLVPDAQAGLRRDLEATLAEVESARAELTSAQSEHDGAVTELAELDSRLATMRAELAHTEDRRRFTSATERATRETARRARQQLAALERRAEAFRNQLSGR